jgi:hypothetical protein
MNTNPQNQNRVIQINLIQLAIKDFEEALESLDVSLEQLVRLKLKAKKIYNAYDEYCNQLAFEKINEIGSQDVKSL